MSVNPPEGTLTIENSHLDVKGNVSAVALKLGTLRLTPSYGLDAVANVSNSTTHTLELSNAATGLVTTANVDVGGELTVSGNATVSSNLTVTGNATVSSNLTVSGNVSLTGTGSLTVPTGTTAQRPATGLSGMVRFNTTVNKLEFYNGTGWKSVGGITATGGTVTEVGGYRIHTFTTSGTFTVSSGGEVEYLLVAGGGSGSIGRHDNNVPGGGGGAGGMLTGTFTSLAADSYTITIGAGGALVSYNGSGTEGNPGTNSIFHTAVAIGGGRGRLNDLTSNGDGGSGGGSGGGGVNTAPAKDGGSGTAGQGNDGGRAAPYTSNGSSNNAGGGGGGAGGAGNNAASGTGGAGGNGLISSISGSSTTYAGGGGGSGANSGSGGSGGGGSGNTNTSSANSGTDGLGGGGGGARGGGGGASGAGGDGIVIIRYLL